MKDIPDEVFLSFLSGHIRSIIFVGGSAFVRQFNEDEIKNLVDCYDLVAVAYPDAEAPLGFQIIPIKGWDGADRDSGDLRGNTFPVPDEATALRLQNLYGNPALASVRLTAGYEKARRH